MVKIETPVIKTYVRSPYWLSCISIFPSPFTTFVAMLTSTVLVVSGTFSVITFSSLFTWLPSYLFITCKYIFTDKVLLVLLKLYTVINLLIFLLYSL